MALHQQDKYKSSIGFTDLLFNLLVGFVFLFIVAFILINPITKKSDAPKKAEYLVVIEWPVEYNDDVDLYVKDPNEVIVSFRNKTGGLLHLEKDDLGFSNDTWTDDTGKQYIIPINREVITIRGVKNGRYEVAAHIYAIKKVYNRNTDTYSPVLPATKRIITATLIKLNPYREVMKVQVEYLGQRGQVLTLFNFDISNDGKSIAVDIQPNSIVLIGSSPHQQEPNENSGGGIPWEPAEHPSGASVPGRPTIPQIIERQGNTNITFTGDQPSEPDRNH